MRDDRPVSSDILDQLAGMGPFFALSAHQAQCVPPWQPLTSLLQADSIDRRSAQLAQTLASGGRIDTGHVDPRVASSVLQLGLVARLVSPWLGLAALGVRVAAGVTDLRWIPSASSSFELSVDGATLGSEQVTAPAEWSSILTQGLLAAVVDAVDGSPQVLWGNVASAINGAVSASSATRPDLMSAMRTVAVGLLAALPVAASSTGQVGTSTFQRRSCCLLYRVAAGSPNAICGDCVLRSRPARFH